VCDSRALSRGHLGTRLLRLTLCELVCVCCCGSNKTQVRLLIGHWEHSIPIQQNYVQSLNALPNVTVKYFVVPRTLAVGRVAACADVRTPCHPFACPCSVQGERPVHTRESRQVDGDRQEVVH